VFDALSIPAVLAINGSALAAYPAIVRAALERDWEFIGHGLHTAQHAEGPPRRASWPWLCTPISWGTPHRLKYFRCVLEAIRQKSDVKFWTGEQITDWYKYNNPQEV
jgi:hypothetical protein